MDVRHLLYLVRQRGRGLALTLLLLLASTSCDELFFDEDPNGQLIVYDAFYDEVDRHFSFFDRLPLNFDSVYEANRALLVANPNEGLMFNGIQAMIDALADGHTNLLSPRRLSYTGWFDQVPDNVIDNNSKYFDELNTLNSSVQWGTLEGGTIGFFKISRFGGPRNEYLAIDAVLDNLRNTKGIIIDVRSNGGGSSINADIIISRFNDQPRLMFRSRRRLGARDEFTDFNEVYSQVHDGFRYSGPVVVLTNRRCFSATEWFLSGMVTIPTVTVVGDTTGGGSGNPLFRDLPNGFTMRVSNTQKLLPNGRDWQFTGIYPDIPLWNNAFDTANGDDTILDKALELLDE